MGESFTIQISSKLVNQLADNGDKLKKKTKKPKTKVPQSTAPSQTEVPKKQAPDSFEAHKGAHGAGWPLQSPIFVTTTSAPPQGSNAESVPQSTAPSQTKVPKKQAPDSFPAHGAGWPLQSPIFVTTTSYPPQGSNAELEAIRSVLQESERVVERLQKQEENMAQEVTQRAKELHDKEFKLPYQKPLPCLAEKDACLDCYKEYSKDPLKCAQVVRRFADCARIVRQQVSAPFS